MGDIGYTRWQGTATDELPQKQLELDHLSATCWAAAVQLCVIAVAIAQPSLVELACILVWILQGHRALLLDAIEAVSTADLAAAAAVAAAGTPADDFAPPGTSTAAAAALLVAGTVAARAAEGQRSPSRRPRGASASPAGVKHGAGIQRQGSCGLVTAGSGSYSSAAGWEAAAAAAADAAGGSGGLNRVGSASGSPVAGTRGRPNSAPAARGRHARSQSPTVSCSTLMCRQNLSSSHE
jgi:hypothetical protein